MSKLLITSNFEPFKGEVNKGIICMPMPCVLNNEAAFYVPNGWQEDLTNNNISFTEVDESEIILPILTT